MAGTSHISIADEKNFEFTASLKRKLIIAFITGVALFALGAVLLALGIGEAHHGAEGHHAMTGGGGEHGHYHWTKRLWANIWLCTILFTGITLVGVFFTAVQFVAHAGWSVLVRRVPETFGYFLPITGVIMLVTFLVAGHDLFHWTHSDLYKQGPGFDEILYGKSAFFFYPLDPKSGIPVFFLLRMVLYFSVWFGLFLFLRKLSLKEDQITNKKEYLKNPAIHNKLVYFSAVFIIVFAVTSSTSAWDWVMSIDAHWFSTMFGWYCFASWFVTGVATTTLTVVLLKEQGYLQSVNENHLHDLGKFMFAFSVFWTYIWFSQFLLYYYANIPEEIIYFHERMVGHDGFYRPIFFLNIFLNFIFPFLSLMTRNAKRTTIILKIVACAILVGHWLDFYMMIMPGTVGKHGGIGFVEFGTILMFASSFIYVFASNFAKANIIPKNDPFLKESLHHVVV